MTKLKETLLDILKEDQRLFDEQSELKENLLRELIDQYDPQLIELLLNHEITRQKFFVSAGKAMVFKGNDFKFFIDENKLDNSYTQFENKIGLKVGSRLLREYRDVVLNFPYKDCVLEGGQSTEEGTDTYFEYNKESGNYDEKKARRKEIFFNQILAKDEIDRLFEPKAFANVRKYQKDENGSITESEAKEFTRDKNGDIKDNLIIKGNNLLALHSLKEQFRGKVKLIYIDPPYNTGNDSFAYNDNFNHSSWLVFMKNRLEIARELLREDGVIFVQCDDNEQGYLKVLMDEVYGRSNFISNIVWKGRGGRQDSKFIAQIHETIIVFSKNLEGLTLNKRTVKDDSVYPYFDSIKNKKFKTQILRKWGNNSRRIDRPNLFYPVYFKGVTYYPLLPNGGDGRWRWSKENGQ
ncbi:MAG: site-specific DNA-methyltransferase [Cytophagaceae bacterium]|nr:site-specific DNA-methyltransferase [Cytophagaceae bacterium]